MIFFLFTLASLFAALVGQHFIDPIPPWGARVMLLPVIFFYGALAFPPPGMLVLAFVSGLCWDAVYTQVVDSAVEIAPGWSVIVYAALGALMSGFRPLFQRGRWEVHCLLTGVFTSVMVFAEYMMISVRRPPVSLVFNEVVWGRVIGAGAAAALLSPVVFFLFNYLGRLAGYPSESARREGE